MDEFDHPLFLHGMDVGESIGEYNAQAEAQRAYDMGEIELWLAFYKPKTISEWVEWELEHGRSGDFEKRWAR